jgi:hypothetical protein
MRHLFTFGSSSLHRLNKLGSDAGEIELIGTPEGNELRRRLAGAGPPNDMVATIMLSGRHGCRNHVVRA